MTPEPTSARDAGSPLRDAAYRTYWLVGLVSNFGWLIQMVGVSWLMVAIGGSTQMIAMVQMALALPVFLFSLPAGTLADTFGRRALVLWSQGYLVVVSVLLAACAWVGVLNPVGLLVFTFLVGAGRAAGNPAWQTRVSEIIDRKRLSEAISLNSISFNLARSLGPALGGVIVAVLGAFAAFALSAVSCLLVFASALRWDRPAPDNGIPQEPFFSGVQAGLRYVALSPNLRRILFRAFVFNVASIAVMALLPVAARDLHEGGSQVYGILLGAFGFGAIGGAVGSGILRRHLSVEGAVRAGFLITCLGTLGFAWAEGLVLHSLASVLAGAGWVTTLSTFGSSVQSASPRWALSRTQALYQSVIFGGNALGSWVWGVAAEQSGLPSAMTLAAGTIFVGLLLGLLTPIAPLELDGLEPAQPWDHPPLALPLLPRSGPILVTVTYAIKGEDIAEFTALMALRRRQRTRDGARRWILSRDMSNPDLWYERYKIATWGDTLRHFSRRTTAAVELRDRIRALSKSPDLPRATFELVRTDADLRDETPLKRDFTGH